MSRSLAWQWMKAGRKFGQHRRLFSDGYRAWWDRDGHRQTRWFT